jgi:hypothetical protein
MKLSKELVDSIAKETRQSIVATDYLVKTAMKNLLLPFGSDGIYLNEHCEGCWMPTCEVSPSVHKVITAVRCLNDEIQVEIDGKWRAMRYVNDLPFLFDELISAIECELELD